MNSVWKLCVKKDVVLPQVNITQQSHDTGKFSTDSFDSGNDEMNDDKFLKKWLTVNHYRKFRLCELFRTGELGDIEQFARENDKASVTCYCCGNTALHLSVEMDDLGIIELVMR